ncbi:MAG TPA: FtsX-like permease family protein [Candidatus Bathyarchaeia archaeon]|nr:FtsX-like permease family protein [Candidatus Bathyarchaeia archaeon]
MTWFSLVRFTGRGLRRRPVRTILTVVGLAALILTFVSVQSLVSTLEINLVGSVSSLGGQIDVWSRGASYPLVSKIPESYADSIRSLPGVTLATPVDLALLTVASDEALVAGIVPAAIPRLFSYSIVKGSMIASNQSGILAMGNSLALALGTSAGDAIQLNGLAYHVLGVYSTNTWIDNSVIIPHVVAQQMIGMVNGTSMIIATTQDPRNIDTLIGQIKTLLPATDAFRSSEAPSRVSPLFASLETIAADITAIVTLGAVLGIMNSNLNNLRERMRTFAIFKATGASYGQIMRLVLYESLLLGILGTLLGLGISYVALQFVSIPVLQTTSVRIFLVPSTFIYASALGVSISLVAAIYPALRIARVRPQEVFRFG